MQVKALILFLILSLASVTIFFYTPTLDTFNFGSFSSLLTAPHPPLQKNTIIPDKLVFVGDIMLGRRVETYLDIYGYDYAYQNLPKLSSTTVFIANFEAPIPEEHTQTPDLTMSFSVDSAVIPALASYGVDYLSLANNHTWDKGERAYFNTQKVLIEQNIIPFGDPLLFSTSSIRYVTIASTTVALVGLHTLQTLPTEEELQIIIDTASQKSDFQIAYMHWGEEYQPIHSRSQQLLAYRLVDAGFDTIIGNHPHVVQDIELYKNIPIFYSLGNFIFDQYFSPEVQEGLWVSLRFEKGSPVYILQGITSIGSRSVPRFMAEYENNIFLKDIAKKSTPTIQEAVKQGVIRLSL